jgi:hypothetical protein
LPHMICCMPLVTTDTTAIAKPSRLTCTSFTVLQEQCRQQDDVRTSQYIRRDCMCTRSPGQHATTGI